MGYYPGQLHAVVVQDSGGSVRQVIGPFPSHQAAQALMRHWLKPAEGYGATIMEMWPSLDPEHVRLS